MFWLHRVGGVIMTLMTSRWWWWQWCCRTSPVSCCGSSLWFFSETLYWSLTQWRLNTINKCELLSAVCLLSQLMWSVHDQLDQYRVIDCRITVWLQLQSLFPLNDLTGCKDEINVFNIYWSYICNHAGFWTRFGPNSRLIRDQPSSSLMWRHVITNLQMGLFRSFMTSRCPLLAQQWTCRTYQSHENWYRADCADPHSTTWHQRRVPIGWCSSCRNTSEWLNIHHSDSASFFTSKQRFDL